MGLVPGRGEEERQKPERGTAGGTGLGAAALDGRGAWVMASLFSELFLG